MEEQVTGTIEVDGAPLPDVELALVAAGGETLAATQADGAGRFALRRGGEASGAQVVARLRSPFVGAVVTPAPPVGQSVQLRAATRNAVDLTVRIELPAGAAPAAWYLVHVTPRALAGLDASMVDALLVDKTGSSRLGSYFTRRVDEQPAHLRLQRGTWDLHVDHVVDQPTPRSGRPANWQTAHATLPDGRRVDAESGAVRLEVGADLEVRVTLRPFPG